MGSPTQEISRTIRDTGKVNFSGRMEEFMKGDGKKVNNMELACLQDKTRNRSKVNGSKGKGLDGCKKQKNE